jgi:hypothetical protein
MPAFQNTQSLAPGSQTVYSPSPHLVQGQGHGFQQPQHHITSLQGDDNTFKYPVLGSTDDGSGISFDPTQMPGHVMGGRGGGVGYPTTSSSSGGGYGYHRQ